MEKLIIGGREFSSRLFLGTGKFNSNELMAESIKVSGTEMVTVAMKRVELDDKNDDLLNHIIKDKNIQLLPNTSGVRNADEAVFAAQMSREAFGTNWLKLEIHPDPRYLLPDTVETLKATEQLVKLGFVVLPYCQADPVLCKQLEEVGAAAVSGQYRDCRCWRPRKDGSCLQKRCRKRSHGIRGWSWCCCRKFSG